MNYSQVVFAVAGTLAPEQVVAMSEYSQGIKVLIPATGYCAEESDGYSLAAIMILITTNQHQLMYHSNPSPLLCPGVISGATLNE